MALSLRPKIGQIAERAPNSTKNVLKPLRAFMALLRRSSLHRRLRRSHGDGMTRFLTIPEVTALMALSTRSHMHGALNALSWRSHRALISLSLRSHHTFIAFLSRSHRALIALSW
ncbi:hypothetical protein Bbelb_065610 [Branchiostoma belcheri]|nr:hypothetical protein Bbelb_065610 [Branchiostoma belcheri]